MTKRRRFILGNLFFALMFVYFGVSIYQHGIAVPRLASSRGWSAIEHRGRVLVVEVMPEGPATSLRVGDELVALNGTSYQRSFQYNAAFRRIAPHQSYTLTVRRNGRIEELTLQRQPEPPLFPQLLSVFNFGLLIAASFLVTGFIVFLLKPYDKQALLLALTLGLFIAVPPGFGAIYAGLPWWLIGLMAAVRAIAQSFFFPIFLHLFLVFPEDSPLVRRWPRVQWYIYLPCLLVLFPLAVTGHFKQATTGQEMPIYLCFAEQFPSFSALLGIFAGVYVGSGLMSLVVSYRSMSQMARRKMRVVVAGSVIGFMPLMLLVLLNVVGAGRSAPQVVRWIDRNSLWTLPLMPLSFAYAIIRHKVIPVSFIIRRSVRYLLVSRGSIVLETVVVFGALTLFLTVFFNYLQPSRGIVIGVISGVVAVVVWNVFSALHVRVIAPVIDRRFFREAYDAQSILAELAQAVRTVADVERLLELVANKLQQALHTRSVTVFLHDEGSGDYVCAISLEYKEDAHTRVTSRPAFVLPHNGLVVERLRQSAQPLAVDFTDPDSWLQEILTTDTVENAARHHGLETLQSIDAALLLPLAAKEQMLGIVSLGPRLGDLPYSGEDERLLMSVAAQTSFALDNARLVERMIAEERRRQEIEAENEQRARELEEARQLQLSMLPRSVPQLPGLDIAAYMKTATEVGGDYYDFHVTADGTLTVAVGDATGHGLKAGAMVTAAKSLFNALAHEPDIVQIFKQSTRALKGMNLRSLFMAMVMVKIKDNRLSVSAAGMPPLLLYRAAASKVEELVIRGMPLGSVTQFPYQQVELTLSAGDTIVLMSDGFPERFNERGEILDYAKTKLVLEEVAAQSPGEIIEHFVRVGEEWAGSSPQNDDVTFVVLKVKNEKSD